MDHCRQIVSDEARLLAGPETCEYQNRLLHAGLAHGDAFLRAGDTKPVGASLFESLGHLRAAVSIAIAFDDGKNSSWRFTFLFRRIHELLNSTEIFRQRAKGNFRPNRTSHFLAGTLLYACHDPSEKFSLRHPAVASGQPVQMPRE